MPDYEVAAVSDRVREWNAQKGGAMLAYRVDLKGSDGNVVKNCEWSRKKDSPPPAVGQQVAGTIDLEAQYGPKFKQQQAYGGGGGFGGGPRPEDPKKSAHIARMHAQGVAVHHAQTLAAIGRLPEDFNLAQLKQIIDWFEKDARAARDAA